MIAILTAAALLGCGSATRSADPVPGAVVPSEIEQIDVQELARRLEAGTVPVLLDVREPRELARGAVLGSRNLPLSQLTNRIAELAPYREGPVYLVCQSGRRSQRAAKMLSEQGFTAVNVRGGTGAWLAAGLPEAPRAE